jgi:Asp-tRNA(Asn)/Glu-tRNA(Gln) amidotransferase A subunit family amidase
MDSSSLCDLTRLSAVEALRLMNEGRLTARALVAASLERIGQRDAKIGAWLALSETALEQADRCDALAGDKRGRLHGLPIGVKDVFDTDDLPTTHNSPLYERFRPAADAAVVDLLRSEGAIILGKTDTTEFAAAGRDAATANPLPPLPIFMCRSLLPPRLVDQQSDRLPFVASSGSNRVSGGSAARVRRSMH